MIDKQKTGLDISDALNVLQELLWLIALHNDLVINRLLPSTVEAIQERFWMANTLVERMEDDAKLIRTILERLEMVCDEMQEAEK